MLELTDIGTIKALLARHGFHFSKALGQNFIVNPSVCPRMADESGIDSESGVIEIGAGIGVLTAELAKRAKKVVCIELDSKLLPILDETLADFDNIEIINADVLKTDLAALIEEKFGGMPVYVCANLPYYITSPVIMTLLERRRSAFAPPSAAACRARLRWRWIITPRRGSSLTSPPARSCLRRRWTAP